MAVKKCKWIKTFEPESVLKAGAGLATNHPRPDEQVVYEYMPFHLTRGGTKEVELLSEGQEPFTLTLTLAKGIGTFSFHEHGFGFIIGAADKYIRALHATAAGMFVEAHNLQTGKRLFWAKPDGDIPLGGQSNFAPFFQDATRMCDLFGVEIHMNRELTIEDAKGFSLLRGLMEGSIEGLGGGVSAIAKPVASDGL